MSRLDEIKKRRAAATPGPWARERGGVFDATRSYMVVPTGESEQDERDADLIAYAPTDIDWLIAEVERLTEAMNHLIRTVPGALGELGMFWLGEGRDAAPLDELVEEA